MQTVAHFCFAFLLGAFWAGMVERDKNGNKISISKKNAFALIAAIGGIFPDIDVFPHLSGDTSYHGFLNGFATENGTALTHNFVIPIVIFVIAGITGWKTFKYFGIGYLSHVTVDWLMWFHWDIKEGWSLFGKGIVDRWTFVSLLDAIFFGLFLFYLIRNKQIAKDKITFTGVKEEKIVRRRKKVAN